MEQEDRSLWLILALIAVFSVWYTVAARSVNALWLVLAAVCVFILAYRLYGAFVAARAAQLTEAGPAVTAGGLPTGRWVLFGYQFAAIAGAGIIVGPVLASQFGFLPGYLWALIGAVFAGAVHDLVILIASARRKGLFLPLLINEQLGPWAGLAAWGIVAVALPLFLAVTGSLLADLLVGNAWALYTLTVTVLVAVLVSSYETWVRPGHTGEAIAIGVVLAVAAIVLGARLSTQTIGSGLLANRTFVILLIAFYCFVSSLVPLQMLARARGAISGYIALGGVIFLAALIAFAAPSLRQPAVSQYASGGGPLVSGGVIPYIVIIVTAGAISGFSALFSTGVSSRMLNRESDALPVGFGSMLVQTLLVVCLIVAVSTLYRWDFYAITTPAPLSDVQRIAGPEQRDWDNLRNLLRTDLLRVPGGPQANGSVEGIRAADGTTALSASIGWMLKDFPGFKQAWLPTVYRFLFVLQALILFAAVEAAALVGKVAIEQAAQVALRTPPLARTAVSTRSLLAVTAAGALVFALVWGLLAAQTDIGTLFSFFGFTALLLAAVGLGAGLLSLRSNGRWALIAVGVPFAVVVAVALIVGIVNVRDAGRYVNKSQALVHAYAEMPRWGQQFKFINVDRAREVVKQWPAGEMAALYASGGQGEVARQLQNRFGIADADATKLASALNRQASGLSLWSWLEIVLTLFLGLLAAGVVLGRFIGVPMRWPAAAVTQAGGETLAAPADVAEATAAGEQNFEI